MPKTAKAKKKVSKPKTKVVNKPKATTAKVVSKGKFLFVKDGTIVQIIKWDNKKIKNILFIFLFKTLISKYLQ